MLLENEFAGVHGRPGAVGSAVSPAVAGEAARVFLTGRPGTVLDPVAKKSAATGGVVDIAEVDRSGRFS